MRSRRRGRVCSATSACSATTALRTKKTPEPTTTSTSSNGCWPLAGCSCRSLVRRHCAEPPHGAALDERGLALEDLQRLLESGDLGLEAGLPLLVSVRLLIALPVELREVIQRGVQLLLHARAVGGGLSDRLVEFSGLLRLVLDILVLRRLLDLILLGLRVVGSLRALLIGSHLRQALGEV